MGEGQSKLSVDAGSPSLSTKEPQSPEVSTNDQKVKQRKRRHRRLPRRKRTSKDVRMSPPVLKKVSSIEIEDKDQFDSEEEDIRLSNLIRREKVLELSKLCEAAERESGLKQSTSFSNVPVSPRFSAAAKRDRSHTFQEKTKKSSHPEAQPLRSTGKVAVQVTTSGGAYLDNKPPSQPCTVVTEDSESDSVDWDALDNSEDDTEEEEEEEEMQETKKSGPPDYSHVLAFLTSLNVEEMNQIGQEMSKIIPGFMKNLCNVIQDFKDEKKALGDSSSEEDEEDDIFIGDSTIVSSEPYTEGCDWNKHFQSIISDLKERGEIQEHRLRCYRELSNLALDFVHCAKTYGRLIISEAETPVEHKTIPPTSIGGFAGGDKYIVNNILFKFAVDSHNLFDCEEAAHKVAGHDLKGLISYFNLGIADLHFPLMALVDYLGYRLIAISVLPIRNDSIVYGSSDAGVHIYNESPALERKMRCSATLLNLKSHFVGLNSDEQTKVHSAGDLEGHQVDDKFYLLDFSRSFPPCTYDTTKRNSYLYRLLRPEFVKNYSIPLCPDAYSGFVTENVQEHIEEVEEATKYLTDVEIPKVAKNLDKLTDTQIDNLNLKEVLHENGINLRYMGLVRQFVKSKKIQAKLLVEMIARVIKHNMRHLMREQMKNWKLPLEHTFRQTVIDYLNILFGSSEESSEHFDNVLSPKLCSNFVGALKPKEKEYPLKKMLSDNDMCSLFSLVRKMTSLKFPSSALKEFSSDPSIFRYTSPFHNTELTEIGVRIRHLNIVALAQGYVLKIGARSNYSVSVENTSRLCKLAIVKFKQALEDNPGDKRALSELADTSSILGDYQQAREYYLRSITADPTDSNTLFRYAVFLEDKMHLMLEAEEFYLRTLEVNPQHDHCLQRYGHFLECQGNPDSAEEFFIRASEIRRQRMMGSLEIPNEIANGVSGTVTESFIF